MAEKTIYGQAWVVNNQLLQEQIYITTNGVSENTVPLITDIWSDLTSNDPAGNDSDSVDPENKNLHYRSNGKGYFFWKINMTDPEDDQSMIQVRIECPRPTEDTFPKPYDPSNYTDGTYAKYWVTKLKKATDEYEFEYAIQKKEIFLKGTSYIKQDGSTEEIDDKTIINTDIGDIANLLSLF